MRRNVVELGAVMALLLGGALAWGQPASPATADADKAKTDDAKSRLEVMLQTALQGNPDVRLAAAKVAQAEAELNLARLSVVQKVSAAYQAVEAQKAAVEIASAELARWPAESKAAKPPAVVTAQQKLIDAKIKLAALEAEMPYLLGKQEAGAVAPVGVGSVDSTTGKRVDPNGNGDSDEDKPFVVSFRRVYGREPRWNEWTALQNGLLPKSEISASTADRIRAALDKPISMEFKDKTPSEIFKDLCAAFQEQDSGLLFKYEKLGDVEPLSVRFDDMTFGVALEYMEDSCPGCHVVVRDYGLVFAEDNALPPGAPLLRDFWKGAKTGDKTPAKEGASNPPTEPVKCIVKDVSTSGLARINHGSDDGLAKGNTLEVYRLHAKAPDQSKYLGRIKIVEVTAKEAVGQPVGKMTGPVQTGDQVSGGPIGD